MREEEREGRRREFRRMAGWSAVAHLTLLGLAVVTPGSRSSFSADQVISVDLVSLPSPAQAAPPPKASAAPKPVAETPPPPPEPPKPKEIVLPKNPERDPSKPKPAEKPKPEEIAPKPQPEKELDDLLAEFRKEAGESEPAPAPTPQPETTAVAPTGVANAGAGVRVSPEVMAWIRKAKAHVRGAWVVPPGFRREALETRVVVELDASGALVGQPRITRRSGNPWFDEGVVRAIEKASPLPPPPQAGEWDFVFLPEDAF